MMMMTLKRYFLFHALSISLFALATSHTHHWHRRASQQVSARFCNTQITTNSRHCACGYHFCCSCSCRCCLCFRKIQASLLDRANELENGSNFEPLRHTSWLARSLVALELKDKPMARRVCVRASHSFRSWQRLYQISCTIL